MRRVDEQFRDAMRAAYNAQGFKSYRHAEYRTGIDNTSFARMLKGEVPGRGLLVRWALAIHESVAKWLTLGGYEPSSYILTAENVSASEPETPAVCAEKTCAESWPTESLREEPPRRREVPVISETLHAAIAAAPSREEKVRIAWEYLWLRGPELGLTGWGAADSGARTLAGRIALIRATEAALGIRLLPPDVG